MDLCVLLLVLQMNKKIVNRQVERPACFNYGFSQLSTSEFLKREMEMHETKIHLLCGWSQIVIQKNTFPLQ